MQRSQRYHHRLADRRGNERTSRTGITPRTPAPVTEKYRRAHLPLLTPNPCCVIHRLRIRGLPF